MEVIQYSVLAVLIALLLFFVCYFLVKCSDLMEEDRAKQEAAQAKAREGAGLTTVQLKETSGKLLRRDADRARREKKLGHRVRYLSRDEYISLKL